MLALTDEERRIAAGEQGEGKAIALRIVAEAARLMAAPRLIPIASAHIDGCLYHGDAGVGFAERLVAAGGRVAVPATLNVGALDLVHAGRVKWDAHRRAMARRLMAAYEALGCRATWTCAPYQAGHRPALGSDVAWGESNAVAFVNSVLGARSNRYGDFLDIACAIAGRAPYCGLHVPANRRARVVVEVGGLSARTLADETFLPVLGTWYGSELGETVGAVVGLPKASEDGLKAFGAGAASSGAIGLFHAVGHTPEAPTLAMALQREAAEQRIVLTAAMLRTARDRLSNAKGGAVDAVAVGSPHFSLAEFDALQGLLPAGRLKLPLYACTGRHVLRELERQGRLKALTEAGVELVVDTCVVVAPVLPRGGGVLLTNSAKFAHYAPGTIGYDVLFGSLADCVATAASGRLSRDEANWS